MTAADVIRCVQKKLLLRIVVIAVASLALIVILASFAGSHLPQNASVQNYSSGEAALVKAVHFQPQVHGNRALPSAPRITPQIAREGRMTLLVGDVENAISRISAIARLQNGDVLTLDATSAADSVPAAAHVTLRVPAARFDASMQALGATGKVRERSISANDLSGDISDSSARLRNLRRTESDIRKIMDRSGSVSQVLDAENQLSQVREQIETLEASLQSMQTRVVYSVIDVNVEAESAAAPVEPTAAAQLVTSWHAAVHALGEFTIGILALALWVSVFLPYAALFAGIAWFVSVQARRRRQA